MKSTRQIILLLSPSGMGMVLYVSVTFLIVFLSSLLPAVNKYFTPAGSGTSFSNIASGKWHSALTLLSKVPLVNVADEYLVWAGVGALCYCMVWVVISAFTAARNDYVIGTKYVHGKESKLYWFQVSERILLRVCSLILIVFLIELTVNFWYPTSVPIINSWVHAWSNMHYLLNSLIIFIGWLVVLHSYVVLIRMALMRVRITGYVIED